MSAAETRGPRSRWRPWIVRSILVVLAAFLVSPASLSAASAETLLVSEPGARQELDGAPGWVTLVFAAEVDPSLAKVVVQDESGANVTTGRLIVEGTNVTTQLADGLQEGTYTVRYRVDRSDGQPEGGAYQFAYGDGDFVELEDATWSGSAQEPGSMTEPDPNAVTPRPTPTATTAVPEVEVEVSPTTKSPGPTTSAMPPSAQASPETSSAPSPTPSAAGERPLDIPPWPVWLGVGAFGACVLIGAVAFGRSRARR